MDPMLLAVIALVAVALLFDYINGFHDAANSIATVVSTRVLSPGKAVLEYAARVNQLEHEADRVHQDSIVELFDQEKDPIAVIKWKEIFDFLEAATDRCEDVGNLLEGVVVKHG